ncbi:hypothetical protein HanHA300_Chr11g0406481 [Helianthus annuus]|nr:hypothetical protein HanHA300_Chr11g0406481 [Helianthus annuus]KAJ0517834.1 hypothetical protein HanHA89_Chr11g0430221 [Helianthus annuus]KAJ0685851.1 hypothetical protein HanLR1_Chr11g0407721 [Helianthus annuus]KAJ0689721.1 hypothetical protein HanOQP8_Chr11g0409291 [Helianthus annuus]
MLPLSSGPERNLCCLRSSNRTSNTPTSRKTFLYRCSNDNSFMKNDKIVCFSSDVTCCCNKQQRASNSCSGMQLTTVTAYSRILRIISCKEDGNLPMFRISNGTVRNC